MLPNWARADASIRLLKERMPEWDVESALVKAATINGLYNTNVKWLVPVAIQISRVMSDSSDNLVQAIADFTTPGGKSKNLLSFSSKVCHFFLSADQFPIYDKLALITLRHHGFKIASGDYSAFEKSLSELRSISDCECSTRDLDKYLWLMGALLEIEKASARPKVNGELQALIAKLRKDRNSALRRLFFG